MFRIIAILGLMVTSTVALGGLSDVTHQDFVQEYPCAVIHVECPDKVPDDGSDLVFRLYNRYPPGEYKSKYRWRVRWARGVRKGRIKSGQGTDTLVVSARGPARKGVTATVTITGLPKECVHTASCTIGIATRQ
jgi:hypothetical protein